MHLPRRSLRFLLRDISGSTPERWALIVGGIAVACVVSVRVADTAVKNIATASRGDLTRVAASRSNNGNIDYSVTSSITSPTPTIHLDPCTGQIK